MVVVLVFIITMGVLVAVFKDDGNGGNGGNGSPPPTTPVNRSLSEYRNEAKKFVDGKDSNFRLNTLEMGEFSGEEIDGKYTSVFITDGIKAREQDATGFNAYYEKQSNGKWMQYMLTADNEWVVWEISDNPNGWMMEGLAGLLDTGLWDKSSSGKDVYTLKTQFAYDYVSISDGTITVEGNKATITYTATAFGVDFNDSMELIIGGQTVSIPDEAKA